MVDVDEIDPTYKSRHYSSSGHNSSPYSDDQHDYIYTLIMYLMSHLVVLPVVNSAYHPRAKWVIGKYYLNCQRFSFFLHFIPFLISKMTK